MTPRPSPLPQNSAERVSGQIFRQWRSCTTCGEPVTGGTRGPLPRRHPDCVPPDTALLYQLRAAARLAHATDRHSIGFDLDALAATLLAAGRQTSPRALAPIDSQAEPGRGVSAAGVTLPSPAAPPAAEWTRYGE